jgi:hypothetical protein
MGSGPRLVLNETSAEIRALSIGAENMEAGAGCQASVAALAKTPDSLGKWWAVLGLNQ